MKLIKILIISYGLFAILSGCSSFNDASKVLRNDKTRTADEFLIQKKGPLSQPPDFEKIPEPESIEKKANSDLNSIEKILNTGRVNKNSQVQSSSTQESILKKIKK